MPIRDRAAYMRDYRRRQRAETVADPTMPAGAGRDLTAAQVRIRELEEEVRHLKARLAGGEAIATRQAAGLSTLPLCHYCDRPVRLRDRVQTWPPGAPGSVYAHRACSNEATDRRDAELRPPVVGPAAGGRNVRPFTPAPKPSQKRA